MGMTGDFHLILQKTLPVTDQNTPRKPYWLKTRIPIGKEYVRVKDIVEKHKLHTICTSGKCPNIDECWSAGTATFMILGDICTRSCKFCAVTTGKPLPPDPEEPMNVARSIQLMKLKHCVITSVDRDDLYDGGSSIWAETIHSIRVQNPDITMEVLVPDFYGKTGALEKVLAAAPDVISHNLETVERLTPLVRNRAQYNYSIDVIRRIAEAGYIAKSGIMLGLGESEEEIYRTMDDLLKAGCQVMTLGQYLQPTVDNLPVAEYISPETFEKYRQIGLEKGFFKVESSPLVRSSYHAENHVHKK